MPWKLSANCFCKVFKNFILCTFAIQKAQCIDEDWWYDKDLLRVPVGITQQEPWLVFQWRREDIDVLSQTGKNIRHIAILTRDPRFCICSSQYLHLRYQTIPEGDIISGLAVLPARHPGCGLTSDSEGGAVQAIQRSQLSRIHTTGNTGFSI